MTAEGRIDPRRRFAYLFCVALGVFFALVLAGCGKKEAPANAPRSPLKVAAAADLAFAFKDIGDLYERKTGQKVTFSFGSTGLLAKQIAEGAPFDAFAAANVTFVDDVVKAGACAGETKSLYARGRIVLFTADGAAHKPAALADLAKPEFAKIAIANPRHAPYGQAAREALQKAGIWEAVQSKMVYGENVQQTLQFAQSGNADVAIVALSLATVSGGTSVPIDASMHAPIDQAIVACGTQLEGGKKFIAILSSEEGHAIMRRYGFLLPGESLTDAKPR
jgi:molybdate transport system substrate-binding protein